MRRTKRTQLKRHRIRAGLYGLTAGLCALLAVSFGAGEILAAEGYDQVAGKSSLAAMKKDLISYGMTPVYGSDIDDGDYVVGTECTSSFFRIEKAALTVKDGEMTAVLTMSSSSYLFVYPGTAEEAAAAPLEAYIPDEKIEGWDTFTVPVEALDKELNLAAYSKRKNKWYPRKVLFHASDIPAENLHFAYPDYSRIDEAVALYDETNGTDSMEEWKASLENGADGAADGGVSGSDGGADAADGSGSVGTAGDSLTADGPEAVRMEEDDGEYSIEVDMVGGSGRASVTSPTWLYVKDGRGYAKLLWSSSYYDYMIVGGKKFLNETTDGSNSTFTIPITALDDEMEVVADTTAMGDPLEIEYALTFYSDTVGGVSRIPQEATKTVLIIALVIMVVGGIANYFVKRRRQ